MCLITYIDRFGNTLNIYKYLYSFIQKAFLYNFRVSKVLYRTIHDCSFQYYYNERLLSFSIFQF